MNGESKKNLLLHILDILQKYSDEDHRLSQKNIIERLEKEYDTEVERKGIRPNIEKLINAGYSIEYDEKIRHTKGEENAVWTNFYLCRDFTDSELRFLIDSLLCFSHLPNSQCRELIEKLEGLSSVYFKSKMKHTSVFNDDSGGNKELFYTIEILAEAISKERKVTFNYGEYGADKKMHCRTQKDGSDRTYLINPYQMVIKEGRYYLICNKDNFDTPANYRVDRIMNIKLTDEPVKPITELKGRNGEAFDLTRYIKEHAYMFSEEITPCSIRIIKKRISDVIDVFGTNISIIQENENDVVINLYTDKMAILKFVKSYAPQAVILDPPSLVQEMKEILETSLKDYNEG